MHSNSETLKRTALVALFSAALAVCAVAQASPAEKTKTHTVPPVWTPEYNAAQGPLPDTSDWKVVREEKNLIVRLAPGSDWRRYRKVIAGEVRYTGTEIDLKPRQIAEITDLLQSRLEKDLPRVKLEGAPGALGTLRVDANITDAMANPLVNVPSVVVSMTPANRGRANLTGWVWDGETKAPVAAIEMSAGDEGYEWLWGFRQTGRLRMALRAQSKKLAQVLNQMGRTVSAAKAKAPVQ